MANVPTKVDDVNTQLLESMKRLSLVDNISATIIARERAEGIQSAITYACQVYTENIGNVRQYVEIGLKAIYDHRKCPDLLAASLKTYNLEFATFVYLTFNQDPQCTRVLFQKFANCSSEYEKRFMIDDHIKDHKSAVTNYCTHLLQLKQQNESISFNTLINYAEAHQQLEVAYDILHQHHIMIPQLCTKLRIYLESMNNQCSNAAEVAHMTEYTCDQFNKYVTSLQVQCTHSKNYIEELTSRVEYIWDGRIKATISSATLEHSSVSKEDVNLIQIIHNEISKMCNKKTEIDGVISTLCDFNEELKAKNMQKLFEDMLAVFRNCTTRIWFPYTNVPEERINATVTAVRMNMNSIDEKYHSPPKIPDTLE